MAAEARLTLMSVEDYLERERASDVKHEYVDGELFAFAGASKRHIDIVLNIVEALRPVVRDRGCHVYASDLKVRVAPRRIYYPDVVVTCSDDDDEYVSSSPCLIVEVLSPSTSSTDRREKLQAYRRVEGLRDYLIIEQQFPRVERHWTNDGHTWWSTAFAEGAIPIVCLETDLAVADIYRDIRFD